MRTREQLIVAGGTDNVVGLGPVDLDGSSSLGTSVYNELRQRIVNGQLKSGERLREVELASLLGVSRTPVREAIKRLESEGFASYVSSRGAVVTELTPEQAVELYAMREILEGAAARFAAQHAYPAEIQMLEYLLEAERQLGEDPEEQANLNRKFHGSIYGMAHNRYLLAVLTKARDYMVLLHKTAYFAPGRAESAYREHVAIVDAIRRGDAQAAEEAARAHIREAQRIRMMLQFSS
jgi:DNA-binding GntR family transcriptional regulator